MMSKDRTRRQSRRGNELGEDTHSDRGQKLQGNERSPENPASLTDTDRNLLAPTLQNTVLTSASAPLLLLLWLASTRPRGAPLSLYLESYECYLPTPRRGSLTSLFQRKRPRVPFHPPPVFRSLCYSHRHLKSSCFFPWAASVFPQHSVTSARPGTLSVLLKIVFPRPRTIPATWEASSKYSMNKQNV